MQAPKCKLCGERHFGLCAGSRGGAKGKRAPKLRKEVRPHISASKTGSNKASAPAALKANGADPPARESADAILAHRRELGRKRTARWRDNHPELRAHRLKYGKAYAVRRKKARRDAAFEAFLATMPGAISESERQRLRIAFESGKRK